MVGGTLRTAAGLLLAVVASASGCQTLQQFSALQQVDFALDHVRGVRLAGVDLDGVRTLADIAGLDLARIGAALAGGQLPLEMEVVVGALNPADNPTDARLIRMDWTLLLEGRETVSGSLTEATILAPGVPTAIPIGVGLDLVEFFAGSSRDLIELVLSLTGEGGATKNVSLRAVPIIDTPLGAIRYPTPITVVSGRVGP